MTARPSAAPGPESGDAPDAFDQALADYNAQHGVVDAAPAAAPAPRAPSGAARAAAAVGGVALVLLVTLGTLGFALAAFAGMGAAALLQRRRGRPYTRAAGWLGGVGGAMTAFAALSIALASVVPANLASEIRRQMQARALADAMDRSPGLLSALLGFGALFAIGFYGVLVGSAAWGSAAVLQFGLTGRWPAGSARATRALRPATAPPARDAFDAIR